MGSEVDKKPCPYCGDVDNGMIQVDETTYRQCICSYARALKNHLGLEIASAKTLSDSPLLQLDADPQNPPVVDKTKKDLFLKGWWRDLLPHFKWALGCQGLGFYFNIVTDERLRTVYMGAESYSSRSRKKRDEIQTFNSLNDIMAPDHYQLVIIRLGFLGYKNVAMPGILKEALMIRQAARAPTWIIEDPNDPFVPGHLSYNEDVAGYIKQVFETLDFTTPNDPRFSAPESLPEEEDLGLGANSPMEDEQRPIRAQVHREQPSPVEDTVLSGSKKYKPSSKKRNSNGGSGPLGFG